MNSTYNKFLAIFLIGAVFLTTGFGGTPAANAGSTANQSIKMTIDVKAGKYNISPYIYGTNESGKLSKYNLTLGRMGGNRLTAYNWENNASNAGTDWNNQSDSYLSSSNAPGEAVRTRVQNAADAGAAEIVTIPIQGYVAADKLGQGDVNQTSNYLSTRFEKSLPTKPTSLSLSPDLNDGYVYQDEFVNWLENAFPKMHKKIFYSLDNEPDLWSSTHPRIQPTPVTYTELMQKSIEYAKAIKAKAPESLVFGPASYGYSGYINLQGAKDANGRNFLNFYLSSMKTAEQTFGKRLLDVLDLHWYPEAKGGNIRITDASKQSNVQSARVEAPRSLWDKSYTENSWIARDVTRGPINLIPTLQAQIKKNYPGTKLAFTEYDFGGGNDISGAIAESDVLGIFGREGVFAATYWPLSSKNDYTYAGFTMFRNFDGKKGTFGTTGVQAKTTDNANSSVYASINAKKELTAVLINKSSTNKKTQISIAHGYYSSAKIYVLTGASATPKYVGKIALNKNTMTYNMPAQSVTTIVLK